VVLIIISDQISLITYTQEQVQTSWNYASACAKP